MTKVRSSPAWELLILEVGTIATRWINTGEPIKTRRGIMALSGMFRLGEIYAGHQLAQSLFYKADTTRIDKQLALEVIEMTLNNIDSVGPRCQYLRMVIPKPISIAITTQSW